MDTSDPSVWSCSSQETLRLHLAEPERAVSFGPKFTYPLFGPAETIFGYKGLKIDLAFDCESLRPLLAYKFEEKLGLGTKSIEELMKPFLPEDTVWKSEESWQDAIEEEHFELPRDKIVHSYQQDGDTYDIYKFNLVADPVGLKLHLRMQIFVLLFIEAGSFITSEDPKWELYTVYKTKSTGGKSTFIGFTTTYHHFHFNSCEEHDTTPFDKLKYKAKISQFVILPPFQRHGHGKRLYNYLVDYWMGQEQCAQITVEDPSEDFDDLRDHCDIHRLIQSGKLDEITQLPLQSPLEGTKLVKRQLARCTEMGLVWKLNNKQLLPGLNERNVRLMIKERLYLANKDALDDMEKAECFDKLQTTYQTVRAGYDDFVRAIHSGVKRKASPSV